MLFDKDLFTFVDEKINDWHQAIKIGVNQLVKNNYCNFELYEKIIESINKYGFYFILAPQVALAHAEPGEWCKKVGVSLTIFDQKVPFSADPKHEVKILFTLSAPDADSHLQLLQEFTQVMGDNDFREKLTSLKNKDEIKALLWKSES